MAGHSGHQNDWTGNPWRIARWAIVPVLLLIPLIAMQFSEEVQWTLFDFVFVAVVLSGALIAYEVATRISSLTTYRMAAAVAILTSVMLLWITGAVRSEERRGGKCGRAGGVCR